MTGKNLQTATTPSEYSPPRWLAAWRPDEEATVQKAEVHANLEAARAGTRAAGEMAIGKALAKLMTIFRTPDSWEDASDTYMDALADLPADLLDEGVRYCLKTCRYFPRPAEIFAPIQGELDKRHATVRRLETMLAVAKWPEPEIVVTQEEKERALKVFEEFMAGREVA